MKKINSLVLLFYFLAVTFTVCALIEYVNLVTLEKSCVGKLPQKIEVKTGLREKPYKHLSK